MSIPTNELNDSAFAQKLTSIILDQQYEIARLSNELAIIDRCDRIKHELAPICTNCSFRTSIKRLDNKAFVECVFNAPQEACLMIYNKLVDERNRICHRWTSNDWKFQSAEPQKRTLQQLADAIESSIN